MKLPMSNKELAVQLYAAYLEAVGAMLSNPSVREPKLPPLESIPEKIRWLKEELDKLDSSE